MHCHFKLGYKTKIDSNGKIKLLASVIRKVCFQSRGIKVKKCAGL